MIRLSQKFEFSAAHRLSRPELSEAENLAVFGKCSNPNGHGHNYEVQVTIAGHPQEYMPGYDLTWPHCVYLYYANIVGFIGLGFYLLVLLTFARMTSPRVDGDSLPTLPASSSAS